MEQTVGIIILAAGNSSRLGQPKQLLHYKGFTLLQNTIIHAQLVSNTVVVVVTGANRSQIEQEITDSTVKTVHNSEWETGMASSIVIGLQTLLKFKPEIKNTVITVCDQPFLTSKIFNDLLEVQKSTGKSIVAAAYASTLGVPVLFSSFYYKQLLLLKGQEGAKKLLKLFKEDVAEVYFEKGAIDIDTIEDYNKLIM